jgi:site-specific recombinase XerD
MDSGVVALRTLKRRCFHVREVPLPDQLLDGLENHFGIRARQVDPEKANQPLWSFSRITAWRFVKGTLLQAGVVDRAATTRGLRHGFCVGVLQGGAPLTLVQRWAGHSRLSTTAIYLDVCGPEERSLAVGFWQASSANDVCADSSICQ